MKSPIEEISHLLAMAENSDKEGEIDVAMRRAQKLSTRYGIDLEMARRHRGEQEVAKPIVRQVELGKKGDRGAGSYSMLLGAICRANEIRVLYYGNSKIEMFGFSDEIEYAEMVYAVVAPQMVAECNAYIKSGDWKGKAENISDARRSFYYGFTSKIEQRLAQARIEAEGEAEEEYAEKGQSAALVISDRKEATESVYKEKMVAEGATIRKWNTGKSRASKSRGSLKGSNARLGIHDEVSSRGKIEA